jgi:uncharacterized membrane protein HdeD (DUF308 family)
MSGQVTESLGSSPAPAYGAPSPMFQVVRENLAELRRNWFWFVLLGIALIVLGVAAMSEYTVVASTVFVLVLGCLLLIGGVCYLVGAFFTRGWGGFFLSLLAGILHVAVGLLILDQPIDALAGITLVLAAYFFVEGLFRIVASLTGQFRHWGWMLVNGVITLLLGVLIWRHWPPSSLWVIGLFVGINMFVSGVNYVALGLTVRRLPVG